MPIKIQQTAEMKAPSLVMCIYGAGGVGKTTLATTAPKSVFIDAEQGTKALGVRGIDVPVVQVKSWKEVNEAWKLIQEKDYETIIIDPVGRFLDLLIEEEKAGGHMTLQKWLFVKDRMRKFVWAIKESGKHVIFIAHEKIDNDDQSLVRRPDLAANLSGELVNLCDVVGHMRIDNEGVRTLRVQPEPKVTAKDRFAAVGDKMDKPDITEMIKLVHAAYNKEPFKS